MKGFKMSELMESLKETFELATNVTSLINEIAKFKSTTKTKNSSKDDDIIKSSGNYAKIGSSGYYAQIGSSGDSAQIGSSGNYAKIGSSGNYAKIGSSGDSAQIGSSGDSAQIGSSGNYAKIGSSGYSAQIGSSGNYAKIDSTGHNSVISAIGINSIVKAVKGSWVTLAEYKFDKSENKYIVEFVKTEFVDGEIIKENEYYTLFNKEFHRVELIDGIPTIILKEKNFIKKGVTLIEKDNCFIFTKNNVSAHGKNAKQAYFDWLFKTSERDVNEYKNLKNKELKPLEYWVLAYRTITGACSFGTNNFLENNKEKYKSQMTLNEVLTATKGQYGYETFKEFFKQ